jgi:hypothetical protein
MSAAITREVQRAERGAAIGQRPTVLGRHRQPTCRLAKGQS